MPTRLHHPHVSSHQVVHVLAAAAVALAGITALHVTAQSRLDLQVHAVVQKVVRIDRFAPPGAIRVTREDLARGYVDAPLELVVRSNTAEGYVLAFEGEEAFFSHAYVQGLAQPLQMGPSGGLATLPAPARGMGTAALSLRIRLMLDGNAREGVYPFPYRVSAEPA